MNIPLSLNDYQEHACATAAEYETQSDALTIRALGIAGEAGEVAELVKKAVGHGHVLDRDALMKELGDVLWYVAVLAADLDTTLEDIADINIAKLSARYPNGFSSHASINRVEEAV